MKMRTVLLAAAFGVALLGATESRAALVDGLVENWALDGNYSAAVTPAHVGAQTGSGTFVAGKLGQAIDLESSSGTQSFITIGGPESDFDFSGGSMSLSIWYDAEDLYVNWQALVGKGEGGNWRLARNSGSTSNIKYDLIGPTVNAKLNVAGWHHMVLTVDDPAGVTIYVDGVVAGSNSTNPNTGNNAKQMQIGGNPDAGGRAWDGLIDDVAIWDRALTAGEVSLIWNDGDGASIGSLTSVIPEPVTMLAVGLGISALGGYVRKRRRA